MWLDATRSVALNLARPFKAGIALPNRLRRVSDALKRLCLTRR
jgi:hypothetical protein